MARLWSSSGDASEDGLKLRLLRGAVGRQKLRSCRLPDKSIDFFLMVASGNELDDPSPELFRKIRTAWCAKSAEPRR